MPLSSCASGKISVGLISALKSVLKSTLDPQPKITKTIGYQFRKPDYLEQALTHRSVTSEPRKNYERLEFLGDAVIDIIISRELMRHYPEGDEGLLTKKRAALVQQSFLATIGSMLDVIDNLNAEPSVDLTNEKVANKQQANLVEALIGAVYLDGGIKPAKKIILDTIWRHRSEAWKTINYINDNFKLKIIHGGATQVTGKKIMIFGGMIENQEEDEQEGETSPDGQNVKYDTMNEYG